MRIFVAGATGVIGRALVPLLVERGHAVTGTTRSERRVSVLEALGARAIVVDVYEADALRDAVVTARPEVVVHELTDLPDDPAQREAFGPANSRIRREGTRNLVDAALAAGARRLVAQSIAFTPSAADGTDAIAELERLTTETPGLEGVVLRYGRFYGPDTYSPDGRAQPPCVSLDRAARETVAAVEGYPPGIYVVADPESQA